MTGNNMSRKRNQWNQKKKKWETNNSKINTAKVCFFGKNKKIDKSLKEWVKVLSLFYEDR